MYVSRLAFHTLPGHAHEAEEALKKLQALVGAAGGAKPRVLRTHYASLGAPDLVFEQEAPDLASLEGEIARVTRDPDFRRWSQQVSSLLAQSPKREVYLIVD